MPTPDTCYCGTTAPYADCCQPLHLGQRTAATAEQLMRSRYSAFCSHDVAYLLATHHPSRHGADDSAALRNSCEQQRWLHLDIRSTRQGLENDQSGEVEFIAWHLPSAQELSTELQQPSTELQQLHEHSRFIKENGRWFYVDGDILEPIPRTQPDIGRNQPCWCGSGRKFKQCHG